MAVPGTANTRAGIEVVGDGRLKQDGVGGLGVGMGTSKNSKRVELDNIDIEWRSRSQNFAARHRRQTFQKMRVERLGREPYEGSNNVRGLAQRLDVRRYASGECVIGQLHFLQLDV